MPSRSVAMTPSSLHPLRWRSCVGVAMLLFCMARLTATGYSQVQTTSSRVPSQNSSIPSIADGNLHACTILSMDRAVAVGDRGLILTTTDGGKQWQTATDRRDATYYAVGFDAPGLNPRGTTGIVVGGTIEPLQGRSAGEVAITSDDGQTWKTLSPPGLPRLTGLQSLGHRHWIAWGDWSNHWQSSLFETLDGGESWNARPVPCGHLRSVSVTDEGVTLLIDRSNRVFYSPNGLEFELLTLPTSPFHPLRFCKRTETGWWIGGDRGVLMQSNDGKNWNSIRLPGNDLDHELISLSNIECRGSNLWLVGQPGNVVWRSSDAGRSWDVTATHQFGDLRSIASLNENMLIACGDRGRILLTRNRGNAWWSAHRSGERVAAFAIVSTHRNIPWDVLTYVTYEGRRHASALVLHDQHFGQAISHHPEWSERLNSIAPRMRIDAIQVCTAFPVGDLRNGIRPTDLAYYSQEKSQRSQRVRTSNTMEAGVVNEVVRQMVFAIRTHRPDMIVSEDVASTQPLEAANAVAANQAIQLASNPSFPLFSAESGIDIPVWNVQRTLFRSANLGGFQLAPTMLMNNSATLLSEAMSPLRQLYDSDPYLHFPSKQKVTYRISNQRTSTISQPLEGLILEGDTNLTEPLKGKLKLTTVLASASAPVKVAELLKTRGSGVLLENAWDDALRMFVKSMTPATASDSLWTIAIESRRQGNWHRWYTSLQLLQDLNPDGPMAEVATMEWMTCFGSAEVRHVIDQQVAQLQWKSSNDSSEGSVSTGGNASPFASGNNTVAKVSYDRALRTTPIARSKGTEEFSQSFSRWPDSWQSHKSEPAWAWLITSRYRTNQLLKRGQITDSKESFFWPPFHPALSDWTAIHEQEKLLQENPSGLASLPFIRQRPYLDGRGDESVWQEALVLKLVTAWAGDSPGTEIRLCRDEEFIYILSRCPRDGLVDAAANSGNKRKTVAKGNLKPRQRDGLNELEDHIKFKLDLDRDYATWFEFGWDVRGETLEQCNDLRGWNPTWYIAQQLDIDQWTAEIAIPIASLVGNPSVPVAPLNPEDAGGVQIAAAQGETQRPSIDWTKQVWAISVTRERPSASTESLVAGESDRWYPDQWMLLAPTPPSPAPIPETKTEPDRTALQSIDANAQRK